MRQAVVTIAAIWMTTAAAAQTIAPREGWFVSRTELTYPELVTAVKASIIDHGLVVVTEAGPTEAARNRGIEIPGNRVIGAFNNDFAVRILSLSTSAMIEAPLRFYVTEEADGTATLSYKTPDFVFAPYLEEGGPEFAMIVAELEAVFSDIADSAVNAAK